MITVRNSHKGLWILLGIFIFLFVLYMINAIAYQNDSLIINFNFSLFNIYKLSTFQFFFITAGVIVFIYVIASIVGG